ncbi:isoprenylcysteine carboxylmethyltransferase family protein [Mycobacterium sp. 852002-51961_SCH5331710]|uniref:methyltransferase family protein n=1 Tax=Mycobacterium sp. 852002-51961_SCH5331710 TaxID=1834105 RepID=UPI0007FC12F9|nr:isoprenylcysteine carboxylmethyltransferase family protein [Mycobacterium sp. 852002-51961_SCH5331710]OBB47721.1 hypothetical protein A5752_22950 [Mycobacterium sp. 852002-51961_SCH5331710]
MKIVLQTLTSAVFGIAFFAVLLFVPAGTLNYWQAWVFIAVFMLATLVPSLYLAVRNPAALKRRMKAGPGAETRTSEKLIISGLIAAVVAVLVISALDHRFGWSHVPTVLVVAGDLLVAIGLVAAQWVIIENSYAAATITVETGQSVVTTGLYGIVRHPMYAGTLVMMLGTPLALGSFWALIAVVAALPLLAARIVDEESMLRRQLAGYPEYTNQVRYRLVPYVW